MRTVSLFKLFVLILVFAGASQAFGGGTLQFTEDFGNAGTFKIFRGQVRFADDAEIGYANLTVTNLKNGQVYEIEADEDGNFIKGDLPSGKYRIRVHGPGTNTGDFTLRISHGGPSASARFIIVKLSPGCASGDSGLKLVNKVTKRSP